MDLSGLLLLYKPQGCTSASVTARVKKALRQQGIKIKVGHFGTLDPFATGLLPIAIGQATKLLPFFSTYLKTYRFIVQWGEETTTGDFMGDVTATSPHIPTRQEIQEILPQFRGDILQIPPRFSALKIKGKRAYELARAGVPFELQARSQHISQLQLCRTSLQGATFEVTCNTGTYIRSLGVDIARALGASGHLAQLERTRIGQWDATCAIPLDSFCEMTHDASSWSSLLMSPIELLDDIPAFEVTAEEAQRLSCGLPISQKREGSEGTIVACTQEGVLVALVREKEGVLAPFRVFVDEKKE